MISVTSSVPQGSHLGPLFFLIFINYNSTVCKYLSFQLFVDDFKFWRVIRNEFDTRNLQKDIDLLTTYCDINRLPINVEKCNVLSVSRQRNKLLYDYNIKEIMIRMV